MFYKNGTLEEERFKNLTPLQWLFHYCEIKKMRCEEVEGLRDLQEILLNRLDATWLVIDPDRGKTMLNLVEAAKEKAKPKKEITADNFDEAWESLLQVIPQEIVVPEKDKENRFVTKKRSRKEFVSGIEILDNK